MKLHQAILGHPFVYNHVRPFFLGGLDLSSFYHQLESGPEDVILDIGCGTGNALDYLEQFQRYAGFDNDPVAIDAAKAKDAPPEASFTHAECSQADVESIDPTQVVLCGLLHHLSDEQAVRLMTMAASSGRFRRMHTLDIVYLPGLNHALSNTLASFDRGRFCRKPAGYRGLVERAGLKVSADRLLWNHPRRHIARYFIMTIEKRGE